MFFNRGFYCKIGDPTGRDKTRPPLNNEIIKENSKHMKINYLKY